MSIVYIVSAPSGSGKSTLVNELFKMVRNLDFSISYTTRPPRGSEQNGKEYFFVSRPEFEGMIASGEFLEYAEVLETTTARRGAFCAKRKTEVTTCCWTSMCRERVKSRRRSRKRSASSFCRLTGKAGMAVADTGPGFGGRDPAAVGHSATRD